MTDTQTSPPPKKKEPRSLGSRALRLGLLLFASLLALFLLYRFAGTSHIRGTVQRVYEKDREFRAEVVDEKGEVHVVSNQEIFFPYLKVDTADLHAELNRHAQTAALIDLKIWGFRLAWFSIFPNVIEAEFVASLSSRRQAEAEKMADRILDRLEKNGALKGTRESARPLIVESLVESTAERPR